MGTADIEKAALREHSGEEGKKEENPGELDVKTPPFSFFLSPSFQARLHSTPPLFFSPLRQFPSPGRRRRSLEHG